MKPVKFNFDSNNPNESLDNFKELLKCMQNPRFDSAYIKYDSNVGADNPKFPLVLLSNSDKYEIHIGGVTIGPRSIIAAGSVVIRDIPADSLAAGNPAVVKKSLIRNAD